MIDLSIFAVPWNGLRLVLERVAGVEREDPVPTEIEYHGSLYRFSLENRGRGRMAIVFVLRIAKSLLCAVCQAPPAPLGERRRARGVVHRDVLIWHRGGCPASLGLARAVQAEAPK